MKMTDADLADSLRQIEAAEFKLRGVLPADVREVLLAAAARLAADQQNGGGEVCRDCGGDGKHCLAGSSAHSYNWHKCDTCEGTGRTPQPSIPAPEQHNYAMDGALSKTLGAYEAQQDGKASGGDYLFTSDEVTEAIELLRFHRSSIVTEAIDHMEACLRANVDDDLTKDQQP